VASVVNSSAEIARNVYSQLGPAGLAARTTAEWDLQTIEFVREMLPAAQRILDVGCGYGRIAIPLAEAGHNVVGVDISEDMLQEARRRASEVGIPVEWLLGDMCNLPQGDQSFDVVLCLWLTFHELYQESEQLAALREMIRVLRPGGWALLDGPPYPDTSVASVEEFEAEIRFAQLMKLVGITKYELFVDDCPGRPRQFLRFFKSNECHTERIPGVTH